MPEELPPPMACALTWLRERASWSQVDLGDAIGISGSQISAYEKGTRNLKRYRLEQLLARMGFSSADIDFILLVIAAFPAPSERAAGGGASEIAQHDFIARQTAVECGVNVVLLAEYRFQKQLMAHRVARDRERAGGLWKRLARFTQAQRRLVIEHLLEFQNWAVAERLAEESFRAAPKRPAVALNLAELAILAARHAAGSESWRRRLEGYVRAFLANALRVSGSLAKASTEWTGVWRLWNEGVEGDAEAILPEWRLLDLEAMLLRDIRNFDVALDRLNRAAAAAPRSSAGRILLNRAATQKDSGDVLGAIASLWDAAPLVDESGDTRLQWVLAFNLAVNLCHVGRAVDAAAQLPGLRRLAIDRGNELDLMRVVWLSGRVAAGLGNRDEARASLEMVRDQLTAQRNGIGTAVVSLELAVLYLEEGCPAEEVRRLALQMAWIPADEGTSLNTLAALRPFFEASRRATVTTELAREVLLSLGKSHHLGVTIEDGPPLP